MMGAMRSSVSRLLSLLLPVLLCAHEAAAQDPGDQLDDLLLPRVKELLKSDQAGDVAWGAYLAGKYRLYKAGGGILRELNEWAATGDELTDTQLVVQLHLLDGLLRVGRKAPPAVLARLLEHPLTRDAAFAVMAQDPVAYAMDLVRIAKQPASNRDLVRRAAGQLLIHKKRGVRDLVLYALEGAEITFTVTVEDGDPDNVWNSAVGLGGGRKPPRLKTEPGFPPLVELDLTTRGSGEQGDRVVVPAVDPLPAIYLSRKEKAVYQAYQLEGYARQERPSLTVAMLWLNAAAGTDVGIYPSLFVQWKGAEQLEAETRAGFERRRAELDQLIERLGKRKHLSPRDVESARIPLKLKVFDARGDKSEKLPELDFDK
jgi:hypothetical protein